jgi:hypothetical protein
VDREEHQQGEMEVNQQMWLEEHQQLEMEEYQQVEIQENQIVGMEVHQHPEQLLQLEENTNQQVDVANHSQQIAETENDQHNGEIVENGPHATVGGSPQNGNFSSFLFANSSIDGAEDSLTLHTKGNNLHNLINNILNGNNLESVGSSDLGTGSSVLEGNNNVIINMPIFGDDNGQASVFRFYRQFRI